MNANTEDEEQVFWDCWWGVKVVVSVGLGIKSWFQNADIKEGIIKKLKLILFIGW